MRKRHVGFAAVSPSLLRTRARLPHRAAGKLQTSLHSSTAVEASSGHGPNTRTQDPVVMDAGPSLSSRVKPAHRTAAERGDGAPTANESNAKARGGTDNAEY